MSQVYSTEPATTGRVVFETTHGPIDVNLWCKECPTTTRTFLQLCIDGYYDGMIFHRILSDFLIQSGLTHHASLAASVSAQDMDKYLRNSTAVPSKSNNMSGDSLRWDRKNLEVNPRLRFNHRGQVAMALPLDEINGSGGNVEETTMLRYQFFVTLDEAPFLDSKHVIFGTIAGSTMFNALRIGRTDADGKTGIPTDLEDAPPRIRSVKLDYHPFEDLIATSEKRIPFKKTEASCGKGVQKGGAAEQQSTMEKRRKKRKQVRNLNILSFGDEERDYEEITSSAEMNTSMKSSHDILAAESNFLSSKVDADVEKRSKHERAKLIVSKTTDKISSVKNAIESASKHIEKQQKKTSLEDGTQTLLITGTEDEKEQHDVCKERPSKRSKSMKSNKISEVEARRSKYIKSGNRSTFSSNKGQQCREDDTMAKLLAFKTKVLETKGAKSGRTHKYVNDDSLAARMANRFEQTIDEEKIRSREEETFKSLPGYSGQINQDIDNAGGDDWMSVKFKCRQHADNATRNLDKISDEVGGDGRRMDDYVVFDEKKRGMDRSSSHIRHMRR